MSWKFDYLFYKNFLDHKDIKLLNQFIEANHDGKEAIHNQAVGKKKTKTFITAYQKLRHHLKNIQHWVNYLNERNFGYDISNFKDPDGVLLNVYDSKQKGEYGWHMDSSRSDIFDVKITALINVSTQKYEGGEFSLFSAGPIRVKELDTPGTLVLIKSAMNHKVDVITKGERRTLTLFVHGPKFR